MANKEKEGGCGATMIVLLVLGLILFGVFQCTRCVFFSESQEARQGQRGVASSPNYAARQSPSKADIVRTCESRFAQRKEQVLDLHDRGALDAYGLADIGVLSGYGISIQADRAVLDILEANGSYGLQNDYDGVAHTVCAEVAHDEVLINDGTREPFVNR